MLSKKFSLVVLALMSSVTLQANNSLFSNNFQDDIFQDMINMQKQMDYIFNRVNQRVQSHNNIIKLHQPTRANRVTNMNSFIDRGDKYEIQTDIPESKENKIDINAKDGILSIDATVTKVEEMRSANSISHSRYTQSYSENIALPKDADISTTKIEYQNKKLVITIDKKAQKKEVPKAEKKSQKAEETKEAEKKTPSQEGNSTK